MTLDNAIKNVLDGNAVLFLGSGFSYGAKSVAGGDFPTAKDLAKLLYTEAGIDPSIQNDDLAMAAEIYQEKMGDMQLTEFLRKQYCASQISDDQKYMGTLKWQRIYTTNYDNILEIAYSEQGKPLNTAVLSNNLSDFGNKTNLYIHLNGSIASITPSKLNNELKLTDRSYLTQELTQSPWLSVFRSDLETASAVIFIGYSMSFDLDLKRIIYANDKLAEKCFFILWDKESPLVIERIKKYGSPYPINLHGFVDKVKEVRKTYIPVATRILMPLCFEKYTLNKIPPTSVQSNEVFKLYLHGAYRPEKIYHSIIQPQQYVYYVMREQIDAIADKVDKGVRKFIIHSDLGNGKSMVLEGLKPLLAQKGFKCFSYKKYYSTLSREVEELCQDDNVALFVDNYSGNMDVLHELAKFSNNQLLIFSERSALNDIQYGKIEDMFGSFDVIDVNKLTDDEAKQLSHIFNTYGYWQYLSNVSEDRKIEFLLRNCDGNFRTIILKLLESPDIIERFNKIVQSIVNKNGYYEVIILILALKITNIDIDIEQIAYGIRTEMLNTPSFRNNEVVRELIDFDRDEIHVRSSIVAESVMQHVMKTEVVVNVLSKIYERLNEQRSNPQVKKMLRKLMTFTNLQHILNKNDSEFLPNVLKYYDYIGKLDFCNRNPHYWLQRAIVMLSVSDYGQARIHFETAYSLAKQDKTFDAFQIDNHYARYLLEYAMKLGDKSTCMKAFTEAHNTLIDPSHKYEVHYYPYRVAQNYYPFYLQFFSDLNPSDKTLFLHSCKQMLERLSWYTSTSTYGANRVDVSKAKEKISEILKKENLLEAAS